MSMTPEQAAWFRDTFTRLVDNVDEALLDKKGVLHLENAGLTVTSHGRYFGLGRQLGTFGYSVKKKKR